MAKPSREDYKRLDLAYKNPSHLMHKKMKLVLNHVGWGKFLIDIGCGTGEFIISSGTVLTHWLELTRICMLSNLRQDGWERIITFC